jgi:hypothetical protein
MWWLIFMSVAAAERLYVGPGSVPGNGSPEQPFWSLAAALATTRTVETELLILGPGPTLIMQPSDQPAFGDTLHADLLVR